MLPMPFAPLPSIVEIDNEILSIEDTIVNCYDEIYSHIYGYEQALALTIGELARHVISNIDSSIASLKRAVEKSQSKIGDWLNNESEAYTFRILSAKEAAKNLGESKILDEGKIEEDAGQQEVKAVPPVCQPPNILIGGHCAPPGIIIPPQPPQPCPPGSIQIGGECVDLDDLIPPPPPPPPPPHDDGNEDGTLGNTLGSSCSMPVHTLLCNYAQELLAALEVFFPNLQVSNFDLQNTFTSSQLNAADWGLAHATIKNNIKTIQVTNVPFVPRLPGPNHANLFSEVAKLLYNHYNVAMEQVHVFINQWNTDKLEARVDDGFGRGYNPSEYENFVSNPELV